MNKKFRVLLIVCASTLSLSGCAWFRETGPCLGVGCPGNALGHSAKAQTANTQNSNSKNPNPDSPKAQPTGQAASQ
jgi:hypothetical protein